MKGLLNMKFDKKQLLLYAVTDQTWSNNKACEGKNLYEQIKQALQGGVTCVQLREKNLDEESFINEALCIKKLCHAYNVPLIINDNLNVAIKSQADGIHVGQDDMSVGEIRKIMGPDFIIGATAKTVEQAIKAQKEGATYLGVGAVYPSPTKTNAIRITKDMLRQISSSVSIPTVAIGGITREKIPELSECEISGVALVSAIFASKDIMEECIALRCEIKKIVNTQIDINTALTIAGSDSSGGAGIQADIKTMITNGVYAMSAITALTAQNTQGVQAIMEVEPEFLGKQIDSVFTDIRPDAVKIGMVASAQLIKMIAGKLKYYSASNIVVDPVMIATSGARLINENAISTLCTELLPLATIITPNIPEAQVLAQISINTKDDMIKAATIISNRYKCAVLCKGGHRINDANDLLFVNGKYTWFNSKHIDNPNTHGTGCTLSSAIAANLAKGYDLSISVEKAKDYVSGALESMMDLGKGSGPLNHAFGLCGQCEK